MRAWRARRTWAQLAGGLAALGAVAWIASASLSRGWRAGVAAAIALAGAAALVQLARARRAFALLSEPARSRPPGVRR